MGGGGGGWGVGRGGGVIPEGVISQLNFPFIQILYEVLHKMRKNHPRGGNFFF